ncbi:MAG: hypothetical protein ACRDPK_04630 [Carbonactinosporaceae bacterium]
MEPFTGALVTHAARLHARSALPDAPVRPERSGRPPRVGRRMRLARTLHHIADRLEPTPVRAR